MNKKKIIIITRYFYPLVGGIINHVTEVAKRLSKIGWHVEIFTLHQTHNINEKYQPIKKYNEYKITENIRTHYFKSYFELVNAINNNESIIYLNNFHLGLTLLIFIKSFLMKIIGKKMKIILVPHGGYTPCWEMYPPFTRSIKRLYHKTIGRYFINRFVEMVIALNDWERKQLIKNGIKTEKIVVIPNGIEHEAFKNYKAIYATIPKNILPKRKYLIMVCRISKEKNIHNVIKAIKHFDKLDLIIGGYAFDKKYFLYLKRLIKKLKLEDRVLFVGFVRPPIKYYLIDNSEAFILTSLFELDPLAVKEAMARGKIVIVSNKGALPSLVRDGVNGFVVSPDEMSIVEGIKKAISLDEASKKLIREKNIETSKKYKWDNIFKKINYVLTLLVSKT
ncbi:MAG: glycosyltransferase family 4 protein [Candidatus Asgardarchaeia archaeon]